MNRVHLHPAIAILLFGIIAFASGLFVFWVWHQTLHLFYDLSNQRLSALPLLVRVFGTVVLALILRFWVRVESLGGWILCGVGIATLALPLALSIRIMAGQTIEIILYYGPTEVPYGPLLSMFAVNLIVGAIHGGLGWLFMQRLASNRSRAS